MLYDNADEDEIDIYETGTGKYIDTTATITIVEEDAFIPTLRIDVEADKFKKYTLMWDKGKVKVFVRILPLAWNS